MFKNQTMNKSHFTGDGEILFGVISKKFPEPMLVIGMDVEWLNRVAEHWNFNSDNRSIIEAVNKAVFREKLKIDSVFLDAPYDIFEQAGICDENGVAKS